MQGLRSFRAPDMIQGVILNQCSPKLCRHLTPILERETGLQVLGHIPRMPDCALASRHLVLITAAEVEGLQEKIQSMPLSKSRGLQRFFFSGATDVETDKQGRILIPQPLRDHAGLTKDVTFVGVSSRVEIWDTSRWNQVNGELTEESIAEAMDELGI